MTYTVASSLFVMKRVYYLDIRITKFQQESTKGTIYKAY